jgi:hypothetical protein
MTDISQRMVMINRQGGQRAESIDYADERYVEIEKECLDCL